MQYTGDVLNNGNSRQYKNKIVCGSCTEIILVVSTLSLFFCLFTSCSASVSALQIVFIDSSYESTTQWEKMSDFQSGQSFGACLAAASVTETVTLLGNPENPFAKL
jgi:hypothetical protein